MTATLPGGLINPTAIEQHDFDDSDISDAVALRSFWKVYATISDASQDDASTRSRNLFWRIWSSPNLAGTMTSARLVRLWRRCSEDTDLTPIEGLFLPRITQGSQDRAQSPCLSPTTVDRAAKTSSPQSDQAPITPNRFEASSATQESRSTRGSVSSQHGRRRSQDTTGSTSHTTPESSTRPSLTRTSSGGRTRGAIVATAGRARTRPQLGRRKSSSARTVTTNNPRSPRPQPESSERGIAQGVNIAPPAAPRFTRGPPPGLPNPPATTSGAGFHLPTSSSWQSVNSGNDGPHLGSTAPVTSSADLVDRDFRGKFVESQRKLASSTNLASLDRRSGSVVRFADEIPRISRKGKSKETSPELKTENMAPSRLRSSITSDEFANDQDESSDDQMELPRVKSSLSLLIKTKREEIGRSDLGPEAAGFKGKGKEPDKSNSKEEELLSMGRRGGVTKAGGVQVPESQRVSEHDDPGQFFSSSPEPLF
ncbi:hypothetical protein PV11_08790 [Exophiala sideris]|uniref:Nitrogen regulatory protein areA GATA-like domain-containing protein n=2 Tax=Exophiala sideris TaxID=1016849 RepID=A0A0D1YPM9_9EURO|nr:hypothetical protein PV11_08790 [Exophiala sideris]